MRWYYMVWVDCITNIRVKKGNEKSWKKISMAAMCSAMTTNLVFCMAILQRNILGYYFYDYDFPFLPEYMSNLVGLLVLYVLPILFVNYLLVFRNNRYEILLKKYPYNEGKLFASYFISSMLIPVILLWIGLIFFR